MNHSENRAKKAAAAIAMIRATKESFTYEEGLSLFKHSNCPYSNLMMSILIKANIIEKRYDKEYYFVSKDPVFYGALRPGLDQVAKNAYNSCRKFQDKMQKKKCPPTEEQDIEEKISFLKQRGYRIFKEL